MNCFRKSLAVVLLLALSLSLAHRRHCRLTDRCGRQLQRARL
jgi:hypothetical protein